MAHAYSTDSPERRRIPFFIAAAAIGAPFLLISIMKRYVVEVPWWASPPVDTMTFYGFFYWLFDRFLWKWSLLHRFGIVRVPNLSGTWQGRATPTETQGVSAGHGIPTDITLTIGQTWTTILVAAQAKLSRSRSILASLTVDDECALGYEYVSDPTAAAPPTMHAHRGLARLVLDATTDSLEGEYYSGRDRQNVGSIRVTRVAGRL